MRKQTAWLVDSNIYVYEAWNYCKEPASDIAGNPIHGVAGFLHFVYQLLSTERPATIAFAFDEKLKNSHRKAIYPDYKANRKPLSPELALQFKYCRNFLDALGLYQSSSFYYEADDLIGTWATQLREQDYNINIITADKDLQQLIRDDDIWWSYQRNYKYTVKSFHKRHRIYPYQVAEQLALAGDKSDNIPGVSSVGMSTAAKLLRKFGDIETLLARQSEIHKMQIRYSQQIQDAISEHHESIRLAQQLCLIRCDIEEANSDEILKSRKFSQDAFTDLSEQLQLTKDQQKQWRILIERLYPDKILHSLS
ncbi:MAG TPA: flap endonuclease [Leucothrix mucor]|nr:flap endonuclease [Leucothrix mucor]